MIEIFSTKYYTTGVSILLAVPFLLVLAAQVVTILARSWETKSLRVGRGVYVTLVLLVAVLVGANWDVFITGQQAKRLCAEQGGLHVYKMVKADGFLGDGDIKFWTKYGFRYAEREGVHGGKLRVIMENGKRVSTKIANYESRYEVVRGNRLIFVTSRIRRSRIYVKDRRTGAVLGELVTFTVYPGWFDSRIRILLGGGSMFWKCGDEAPLGKGSYYPDLGVYRYGHTDLVRATIQPRTEAKGDKTE